MCGIAGIVAPVTERLRRAVRDMTSALEHRGPDGSGIHEYSHCVLGHRRLSIVDLACGAQPMLSRDGQCALTFNGEIYGYRDIRNTLRDYDFQTTSDTEVILALNARYGEAFLPHLPGMFALALWNEREQTLLAARDRFGEKPFFYAWGSSGEFLFASEIKALLASGLIKPRINRQSLAHFLQHLYVHPHHTVYENVFALPPAHRLTLRKGSLQVERYWQLPPQSTSLSKGEAVEQFKHLFEQSVSRQMVADVPVGAFLSGGLDSSSIVAVASQLHPGIKTLAFGFGASDSELPFARDIALRYGTEHIELEDRAVNLAQLLVTMAGVYDEPFADSSNIPTYLIAQRARQYSKVVLTGDGGDELLAGYDFWYRPLRNMQHLTRAGAYAVPLFKSVARMLVQLKMLDAAAWNYRLRGAALKRHYPTLEQAHRHQNLFFSHSEMGQLGFDEALHAPPLPLPSGTVDDALRMDLLNYMPGDILTKIDRASMAHGLELRAPFLDVEFASFCIGLPLRLKMTASEDKWILRQCYQEAWTQAVRRRRKQGFGAPVGAWLQQPDVGCLKHRVLDDPQHPLFSVIPFEASRGFASANNYQTWTLLTLGLWLESGGAAAL